jgi:hypothetical protein
MIIKHASHILRGNGRGRGTYSSCYLSFATDRRENGLFDLSDLALPLLLEAGEKLLELSHLLDLPTFFGSLSVRLEHLALLVMDLELDSREGVLTEAMNNGTRET